MPLTKPMAEHLAALAHLLRDDLATRTGCQRWNEHGILANLRDVAGLPAEDVCLAVIRAAVDQGAKTPGVISSAKGPHWRERVSDFRAPRNPMPHEECRVHPGQFERSCSGCASERLAPVVEIRGEGHRVGPADVRARLHLATASVCSHGVKPDHCLQKHDDDHPTDDPEEAS